MMTYMIIREFSRCLIIARLMLVGISGAVAALGAGVDNGGFEQSHDGAPAGWTTIGSGVSVKPIAGTVWSRGQMVFNSGAYKRVRETVAEDRPRSS